MWPASEPAAATPAECGTSNNTSPTNQLAAYLVAAVNQVETIKGQTGPDDRVGARRAVLRGRLQLQRDGGRTGGPRDAPVVLERLSDVHGDDPVGGESVTWQQQ